MVPLQCVIGRVPKGCHLRASWQRVEFARNTFDLYHDFAYLLSMAEIIPLGQTNSSETLIEFIRREGSVTTDAVAYRFGWDRKQAFKELSALRKSGHIVSRNESYSTGETGGRINGWQVAPTDE